MTDIALVWNNDLKAADIAISGGQLVTDDGLRTAILISLFTDARANDDDPLPEPGADRRGWWGNAFPANDDLSDELGSKWWLLARSKATADVLRRAEESARGALQWIVAAQIAAAVSVQVERQDDGPTTRLAVAVILTRPTGPARDRYDFVWEASA